jgi:hypothetical protein
MHGKSGRTQDAQYTQALIRFAFICPPSAQVKAAAAHVQRLKRNQQTRKLILSLGVFQRAYYIPFSEQLSPVFAQGRWVVLSAAVIAASGTAAKLGAKDVAGRDCLFVSF